MTRICLVSFLAVDMFVESVSVFIMVSPAWLVGFQTYFSQFVML